MTRPRAACPMILPALLAAVGLASPAFARGPEDVKQTGIITREKVGNSTERRLFSHTKMMKLMSDNLADAKQVNIFGLWCASGGLIKAAEANVPSFKYAIGAAAAFDDETQTVFTNKQSPGNTRLKIGDKEYVGGFTAFTAMAATFNWDRSKTFNDLFRNVSFDYDTDPKLKDASNAGKQPKAISEGADGNAALNGGADGNHLVQFFGATDERANEIVSTPLFDSLSSATRLNPKTKKYYFDAKEPGGKFNGAGSKVNFTAAMTALKTELAKNQGKETVNLFLGGHGFYQTVSKDLEANAGPLTPRGGKLLGPGRTTLDVQMGAVEWAFLTAPTTPIDEDPRNARYLPPEVFVTMSEGSVDQPVGIWINDLFLGEFDVAIGSRGGELRVALTDLQIGQIASMYGGAASLNLRVELAGADWFRLGSDSDLLQDDLYDVGYSGAGMSFFMSQVPTPGTLALLALAGLGASRRRRN
jgi:MYXO-CTERM domain-containing protein